MRNKNIMPYGPEAVLSGLCVAITGCCFVGPWVGLPAGAFTGCGSVPRDSDYW